MKGVNLFMFNKFTLPSVIVMILALLSGCMQEGSAAQSENIADDNNDVDHSIYYVQEEAEEENVVEYQDHLNYISTEELMRLMATVMPSSQDRESYDQYMPEWDFVLVDSRPSNVYAEGHINGAINIPDSEFDKFKDLLPKDKDKMIIFYCGGLHCELSSNSANKALDLGYTNVYVYQEGLPFWKQEGNYLSVTPDYVKDLIMEANVTRDDLPPFLIIDARTYSGYFEGHIPTAIFMDDAQYGKYEPLIPRDKNANIVIYCGGFFCHKSHTIADHLVKDGYKNVKVLTGGMPAWKKAGFPTFGTASGDIDFDVSEGKVDRSLTPEKFDEMMDGSNVAVLDVRSDGERAGGAIPGSIHIPDGDIHADPEAIRDQLPEDTNTTILIHCASGARAAGVVEKVADLGFENAYYLNSAIKIDKDGNYSFN